MNIALRQDSNCTGGIENIFFLKPHHLARWQKRGIDNRCEGCGMVLDTIGQLVYTRNLPNKKTHARCIQCALPLIEPDDLIFYKSQVRKELARLKEQGVAVTVSL